MQLLLPFQAKYLKPVPEGTAQPLSSSSNSTKGYKSASLEQVFGAGNNYNLHWSFTSNVDLNTSTPNPGIFIVDLFFTNGSHIVADARVDFAIDLKKGNSINVTTLVSIDGQPSLNTYLLDTNASNQAWTTFSDNNNIFGGVFTNRAEVPLAAAAVQFNNDKGRNVYCLRFSSPP